MVSQASTIDGVIEQLDAVIARTRRQGSRLGYFPALYRRVTVAVKEGIAAGRFDDGPRMERLDVVFANRYLAALEQYELGKDASASWMLAFDATSSRWPLVLQHLLLGMNAHINLDLGVAAAEVAPGSSIGALEPDFMRINEVLSSLVEEVKAELSLVWPPLRLLDRLAGTAEDRIVDFSMGKARDCAWILAQELAGLGSAERAAKIEARDIWAADFGRVVREPPLVTRGALLLIRLGERGDVSSRIGLLDRHAPAVS